MRQVFLISISIAALAACGPGTRNPHGGGGGGGVDAPNGGSGAENTPAACSDMIDNDGDGLVDCMDPDCSGVGSCPVCGTVTHPTGGGIELPDGVSGGTCTTDADCPMDQHCFMIGAGDNECRESYISKLSIMDFGNATFQATSNIQSVCFNAEHSWLRDLEIQLVSPDGSHVVQLQHFEGQMGGEIFLGIPNDDDSGNGELDDGLDGDPPPTPGTGWDYCWSPTATKPPMLEYVNQTAGEETSQYTLPADTYSASDPWTNLMGSPLDGDWEIRVTDLWPIDNGFLFSWTISFDPSLATSCSSPPIQ